MISFRAAYLEQLNSPLRISKVTLRNYLAPSQVLVKMESIGICGSQLLEIAGKKGNSRFLPHMLGHEGVGIVVECGASVSKVSRGDRVVLHWRKSGGLEGPPAEFDLPDGTVIRSGPVSTFSEMSVVSENRVTKIPGDIDSALATFLACGLSTGVGAIDKEINLRLGDSVLIFGAGGVGLSAALAAHLKGAGKLTVVDSNIKKQSLVEKIPNANFIDSSQKTWTDDARTLCPSGYEVVVEATGSDDIRRKALSFVSGRGTLVILGQGAGSDMIDLGDQSMAFGSNGTRVIFSQGGFFEPEIDFPRYATVLGQNSALLEPLISISLGGLDLVNPLIQELSLGGVGRPILRLSQ